MVLSEFVLERGLYQRCTGSPSRGRLLDAAHFDFRGGEDRARAAGSEPVERRAEAGRS